MSSMDPNMALRALYGRQIRELSFDAKSKAEWERWHSELSDRLRELLGLEDRPPAAPACRTIKVVDKGTYTRHFAMMEASADSTVPLYILVPKTHSESGSVEQGMGRLAGRSGGGAFPAVVALHGHGYGVDDIVGIRRDGSDRDAPEGYHKDFAVELVKRGFVVAAPELAGFGRRRRQEDIDKGPDQSSCRHASLFALLLGKTMLGMRVFDTMRVIDYLQSLPEVDGSRIGCMGISGGGMVATFTSALDERIKAAVVSGYLNTFIDSIGSIHHCECNYVPGILKYCEMSDIASLIAPRPLLAESGTLDPIFPLGATRKALQDVRRAYALLGVEERLDADIFEGDHQISGRKSYAWLVRWLS